MTDSKKFVTKLCKILMNNSFAKKQTTIDNITTFLDKYPKHVVNQVLNMFEKQIFENENIRDKFVHQNTKKQMNIVYNLLTYLYDINRYIKKRTINNKRLNNITKLISRLNNDIEFIEDIIVIHYDKLYMKDLKQIYDQLEHKIDMKITKHNPKSKKEFLNAILKWIQDTRTFVYMYNNRNIESKKFNINQKLKIQEELKDKLPSVLQDIVSSYNVDEKIKLNYIKLTKPIIIRLLNDLNKIHGNTYIDFKTSESKQNLFKYLSENMTVYNFALLLSYMYSNSKKIQNDISRYERSNKLGKELFEFEDKSFNSNLVNIITISEIIKVWNKVAAISYYQQPISKWKKKSILIAKLIILLTTEYTNISNNEKVLFVDIKNVMNDNNKCLNLNKSDLIDILHKIYDNNKLKNQRLIVFPKVVLCKMIKYSIIKDE